MDPLQDVNILENDPRSWDSFFDAYPEPSIFRILNSFSEARISRYVATYISVYKRKEEEGEDCVTKWTVRFSREKQFSLAISTSQRPAQEPTQSRIRKLPSLAEDSRDHSIISLPSLAHDS
jgi:hypothetical protein